MTKSSELLRILCDDDPHLWNHTQKKRLEQIENLLDKKGADPNYECRSEYYISFLHKNMETQTVIDFLYLHFMQFSYININNDLDLLFKYGGWVRKPTRELYCTFLFYDKDDLTLPSMETQLDYQKLFPLFVLLISPF